MLNVILTLDYEIHGSGEGSPYTLMVEPTRRMMRSFERFGAKLTIMADVAEISQFKQHAATHGEDRFHAGMIEDQLREAVGHGHDVQLHIHSSYYGARCENNRWVQNWEQYDLARLGYERLATVIGGGRSYLEDLLRPVAADYACIAFRAANWSMKPSADIVRALRDRGIRIDTSVFKHGSRSGLVDFDYSSAFSHIVPWPIDSTDVCLPDPQSELWEVPIYCENRWIWDFLSFTRFYRVWQGRAHPLARSQGDAGDDGGREGTSPKKQRSGRLWGPVRKLEFLFRQHPLKMDFNQCSGRQLVQTMKRIGAAYGDFPFPLPVVLIGHSKLFTPYNERDLTVFLEHVAEDTAHCRFSTFRDLEPSVLRKAFVHESTGRAVQRHQENAQPGKAR